MTPVVPLAGPHALDETSHHERVATSMAAVAEMHHRSVALRGELEAVEKRCAETERRLRESYYRASQLQQEKTGLMEDLKVSNAKVVQLSEELQTLTEEHARSIGSFEKLSNEHLELKHAHDQSTMLIRQRQKDVERHVAAANSLEVEKRDLAQKLSDVQEEISRLQSYVSIQQIELQVHKATEEQSKAAAAEIENALKMERYDRRETVYRYEKSVADLESKLSDVVRQKQLDDSLHSSELAQIRERLDVAISEREHLVEKFDATLKSKMSALQATQEDLVKLREESSMLKKENAELIASNTLLQNSVKSLEAKLRHATEQNSYLASQNQSLSIQLKHNDDARRMLCHSMETLEAFIQEQKHLAVGAENASQQIGDTEASNIGGRGPLLPECVSVLSERSVTPVALQDLMGISKDDTEQQPVAAALRAERAIRPIPMNILHSYRNTTLGPRPLAPHTKAMEAIDMMLLSAAGTQ
jgi:chromosome segregation ATPase